MPPPNPLVAAVEKQDLTELRRLLASHHEPLAARLVVAAAGGTWKAGLAVLAKNGADLNGSYRNYRALHALMQATPHDGSPSTPERLACLEWLLVHGADPELTGAWPAARAVIVAAFVGEATYVAALLKGGAKVDLFTAAALGDAKGVGKRLSRDPGLAAARDDGGLTALQCAAGSRLGAANERTRAGLLDAARLLVEAGADVNVKTRSWSHDVDVAYFAIRAGQVELLKLLLAHGLDATAAVTTAAWEGREEILDLLLAHGARLDEALDGTRPVLNELVRWGQFGPARMLLARGASPNRADERGWTAIHQAVSRGNMKMLRELVAAGGDPRRPDLSGRTPREMAKSEHRDDLLALLP
jgi:ankyrin repeat protein